MADIIATIRKVIGSGGRLKIVPPLSMGDNKITDLADGTDEHDAVNKSQLDAVIVGGGGILADGSVPMAAALDMDSHKVENVTDGSAAGDAVNKGQLDAVAGLIGDTSIRKGKVTLDANGKATVKFQDDGPATLLSTQAGPYNLTGVGNGGTIIVNPDGDGAETVTINFAAGKHEGGTDCSTDMTGEVDTKLKIRANGDPDWHEITCDWTLCNSGAAIATQLQTQIQALGATYGYSAITVGFADSKLTFTSAQAGTGSTIEIARADTLDCCDELDIGPNGTTTPGTGDVINAAAAAAAELVEVINADLVAESIIATAETGKIRLTSKTNGAGSSIVMGDSSLKTVLGLANAAAAYGSQGLGYETDMEDALFIAVATLDGVAQASLAGKGLSITNKAVDGFVVECEDNSATDDVDVAIFGQEAAPA